MLLPTSCASKWYQWLRIWLSRNIRFVGVNVGMSARNRHFQTNDWCITIYIYIYINASSYHKSISHQMKNCLIARLNLLCHIFIFSSRLSVYENRRCQLTTFIRRWLQIVNTIWKREIIENEVCSHIWLAREKCDREKKKRITHHA